MRRRGIAQTVNRFNHGLQRGEITDGVVRTRNVVIDGARQPDAREAHFGQALRTHVGTVAADNHQRVDTAFFHVLNSHGADMLFTELRKASRARGMYRRG